MRSSLSSTASQTPIGLPGIFFGQEGFRVCPAVLRLPQLDEGDGLRLVQGLHDLLVVLGPADKRRQNRLALGPANTQGQFGIRHASRPNPHGARVRTSGRPRSTCTGPAWPLPGGPFPLPKRRTLANRAAAAVAGKASTAAPARSCRRVMMFSTMRAIATEPETPGRRGPVPPVRNGSHGEVTGLSSR